MLAQVLWKQLAVVTIRGAADAFAEGRLSGHWAQHIVLVDRVGTLLCSLQ
jgi:hypothetical protein